MTKKIAWGLGICLFYCSACEKLERNNPLDPQNPQSSRARVVLLEAFVNDATPFSPFALQAVDSISATFASEQILLLEHHLPSSSFVDTEALLESAERYQNLASSERAVPDVFINGAEMRIQGAARASHATLRYRNALLAALGNSAFFTIEAKSDFSASHAALEARVARLGTSEASQLSVLALVWEDLEAAGHHHVVRKVFPGELVGSMRAGESKPFHFSGSLSGVRNVARLQAAVLVEQTGMGGREVVQAALAE